MYFETKISKIFFSLPLNNNLAAVHVSTKTTMASDPKERINLAALQQNDPYIERILETAGQVALYNFNAEANEWVSDIINFTNN